LKKIISTLLLCTPILAMSADLVEKVETEVFKANGSATEIAAKGKACMAELLKNDNIGNSTTQSLFSYTGDDKLVATARFEYVYMLLRQSLQAKYIFEAKEGRFRITNTDIGYKQVKTNGLLGWGASVESSTSHQPIAKVWGTGYEEAESQLLAMDNKIAECVMNEKKSNW
jgi:hypothetical protein